MAIDCDQQQQQCMSRLLTAMPLPLLELILIANTDKRDKKALRETCRLFQQTLDKNLAFIFMTQERPENQQHLKRLLGRLQNAHFLKTIIIRSFCDLGNLLQHLPDYVTAVAINHSCCTIDIRALGRLPQLSFLKLTQFSGTVTGLEYISRLTRLECHTWVGSVAHLAPTLKHLCTWNNEQVQDIDLLTNLEVLDLWQCAGTSFFATNNKLPLRHLRILLSNWLSYLQDATVWESAPTTLTCLTLRDTDTVFPLFLPSTVTHLQLMDVHDQDIHPIVSTIPRLKSLHLDLIGNTYDYWNSAISHLIKITDLRRLGIYKRRNHGAILSTEQLISAMSALAMLKQRGVQITAIPTLRQFEGVLHDPYPDTSAWVTHA